MKSNKKDNGWLESKLMLRRYFLKKFHSDGHRSLIEACQGEGVLWKILAKDFRLDDHLGLDLKPKPGRLRIDSLKYFQNPLTQNIIDIDTYGSPFGHYKALLKNSRGEKTVFLTSGIMSHGMLQASRVDLEILGLYKARKFISPVMAAQLHDLSVDTGIFMPLKYGWEIIHAAESSPGRNARYIGIHIKK